MPVSNPSSPLAASLGNGSVFVHCDYDADVKRYEIRIADSIDGKYYLFSNYTAYNNSFLLYGFPMNNADVFFQIRAIGNDDTISDWIQIKRGSLTKPLVDVSIKSISGSIIPAGALFGVDSKYHRTVVLQATEQITF